MEGPNLGFRFPGVGSVSNDGYFGPYGGLIYAKNGSDLLLWAPAIGSQGHLFHLSELGHWGTNETYQATNNVDILITVWREHVLENVTCPIDQLSVFETATNTDTVVHGVGYNGNITFGCKYGYMYRGGNTSATCDRYGEWNFLNNDTIRCELILCNTSDLVTPNTQVSIVGDYRVDDVVTYACDAGYEIIGGNLSRVCLADGTWSGSAPLCQPVVTTQIELTTTELPTTTTTACPLVGLEVPFAEMTVSDTADTVTYMCPPMYPHVDGDLTRTCNRDGTWSGTAPVCEYCLWLKCGMSVLKVMRPTCFFFMT
ncbi:CUB and sushi domain-containing protein 3-like [Pecten maximus]|uniref:CUB and sushi domain-containing protein 3-like n=1 Tax=Pecten maximus TaxID=6579 RepID=UPI0014585D9E|nr:CUB and sushi domain-containing protein 3-like [Pecten maximus]XP_033730014.1 CUB and sushi domain-containing protein 3-like [Pecten maximus]